MPDDRPLGVVLAHGDPASIHAAFLFAAGAAALGRTVVFFATGLGVQALLNADLEPVPSELRAACQAFAVSLLACPAAMAEAGHTEFDLIAGARVEGLASFLDATRDAQLISF